MKITPMKLLFLALLTTVFVSGFAQSDTARAVAIMKEGTVYYGYGAELTHSAKLTVTKDTRYIIIDKISKELDLNSLQISCPENISLLSQQFSIYSAPKPKYEESDLMKRIKDSIEKKQILVSVIQNNISIYEATLAATGKLIESTIATSGNKTSLTAEVLKLIEFYNTKIEQNKNLIFEKGLAKAAVQKEITALNDRLTAATVVANANYTAENPKQSSYGRVVLQVICRTAQAADINLSYYTKNAGWQPLYDIRVDTKTNAMKLVYKASVIQNTGIDWEQAKLSLSTGTPNFTTTAPLFSAWYLKYYAPELYKKYDNLTVTNSIPTMSALTRAKVSADDMGYTMSESTVVPSTLQDYTNMRQGLLNTIFEIDLPYDIASNGLPHNINIKEEKLSSSLKNYAVPKLDPEAYLLAELTDWQNLDLIPGNANIIMDDTYIGKSFIDPNSTADTLNLSLGKDKRVAVKRLLIKDDNTTKNRDNNIKQTFTYEITVKNNKTKDVDMILKDQFPLSNIKEIEIELKEDGGAVVNNELGVLTWSVVLKPGEIRKFRFAYTVKYPKDKKIQNLK